MTQPYLLQLAQLGSVLLLVAELELSCIGYATHPYTRVLNANVVPSDRSVDRAKSQPILSTIQTVRPSLLPSTKTAHRQHLTSSTDQQPTLQSVKRSRAQEESATKPTSKFLVHADWTMAFRNTTSRATASARQRSLPRNPAERWTPHPLL